MVNPITKRTEHFMPLISSLKEACDRHSKPTTDTRLGNNLLKINFLNYFFVEKLNNWNLARVIWSSIKALFSHSIMWSFPFPDFWVYRKEKVLYKSYSFTPLPRFPDHQWNSLFLLRRDVYSILTILNAWICNCSFGGSEPS